MFGDACFFENRKNVVKGQKKPERKREIRGDKSFRAVTIRKNTTVLRGYELKNLGTSSVKKAAKEKRNTSHVRPRRSAPKFISGRQPTKKKLVTRPKKTLWTRSPRVTPAGGARGGCELKEDWPKSRARKVQ